VNWCNPCQFKGRRAEGQKGRRAEGQKGRRADTRFDTTI